MVQVNKDVIKKGQLRVVDEGRSISFYNNTDCRGNPLGMLGQRNKFKVTGPEGNPRIIVVGDYRNNTRAWMKRKEVQRNSTVEETEL